MYTKPTNTIFSHKNLCGINSTEMPIHSRKYNFNPFNPSYLKQQPFRITFFLIIVTWMIFAGKSYHLHHSSYVWQCTTRHTFTTDTTYKESPTSSPNNSILHLLWPPSLRKIFQYFPSVPTYIPSISNHAPIVISIKENRLGSGQWIKYEYNIRSSLHSMM